MSTKQTIVNQSQNLKSLLHGFAERFSASRQNQKRIIDDMLQPSMGGKAAVKKAPAGKSAKMLDSTEALNLRAKAAFDHNQRQEQRKPAAKRCVCKPGYCCVCVCVFKSLQALQAANLLHHIVK